VRPAIRGARIDRTGFGAEMRVDAGSDRVLILVLIFVLKPGELFREHARDDRAGIYRADDGKFRAGLQAGPYRSAARARHPVAGAVGVRIPSCASLNLTYGLAPGKRRPALPNR